MNFGGGSEETIEHGQWAKGHQFAPRGSLSGTNRKQTARAPEIALQPVAPATEMIGLRGIPLGDECNPPTKF